jgi:hypothetical protein
MNYTNSRPKAEFAFVCMAGLGLGNATRCHAVLEELLALRPGLRVVVFAWGRSLDYFRANAGDSRLDVVALFPYKSALLLPFVYLLNCLVLTKELLARGRPSFALADSDYHFPPLLLARVPVAALNHAAAVRHVWKNFVSSPSLPLAADYWLKENLDYLISRAVARKVLCPSLAPFQPESDKVVVLPPITRKAFCAETTTTTEGPLLSWMGGSGLGEKDFSSWESRLGASRVRLPLSKGEASWPELSAAGALLVQGGLSSLSEGLALKKRLLVLPIRGHAEQHANAVWLENLGLGLRLRENAPPAWNALPCPDVATDGAGRAARFLAESFLS